MNDCSPDTPTVCLMGASLGTGNRGVSALSASLVGLVRQAVPGANVILVIGNRSETPFELDLGAERICIPVVNYRRSPGAPLNKQLWWIFLLSVIYRFLPSARRIITRNNPWIRSVAGARFVGDIRGGDSFSDIYGLGMFISGSIPVIAALLINRNFILFPQTYGPFKSALGRWIAAFITSRARDVISRDQDSIPLAASMTSRTVKYSPDVAFTMEPIAPKDPGIVPPLSAHRPLVGINVNGLMLNGGYNRRNMFGLTLDYEKFLVGLMNGLLRNSDADILFVPHTFAPPGSVESDPAGCAAIMEQADSQYKDRLHIVQLPHNQNEIKWVIGQCDFFAGSRMHSCIAALSQGIPTLGVAYSKKFKGVFDSVGVADWVLDARSLGTDAAIALALDSFLKRDELREKLRKTVPAAKKKVLDTFIDVLNVNEDRCMPTAARPVIAQAGQPSATVS